MTDTQLPSRAWRILATGLLTICVLAALGVLCFLGYSLDIENRGEGVIIGATIGTALGTLALAATTYDLARATRATVREAGAELAELKEQGKVIVEQARIAAEQAAATARLADASTAGTEAAEKSRIDGISPLLYCVVSLGNLEVTDRQGGPLPYADPYQDQWPVPDLEERVFTATLRFKLTNVGHAPARLTFGDTSTFLEGVQRKKMSASTLMVGEAFEDFYKVRFVAQEATVGKYIKMPFTYEGIMHGEMFDHIQWNGWVTPLLEESPGTAKPHPYVVNSSGAQVFRSYPNLERPEEMAAVRLRLLE